MGNLISSTSTGRLISINSDVPAGNTISNTSSEVYFTSQSPSMPASMWFSGRVFQLKFFGFFGTAVVVPSIRGKVYLNSTVIADTGSILNAGSLSNKQWFGELLIFVTAISGSTATLVVNGFVQMQTGVGYIALPLINLSSISLDISTDVVCKMSAQWSTISSSNTITLSQFYFEG